MKRDQNMIGTNYYWNKCFPKWSHWIFLKTTYKNRSERQMQFYSIYGSFVDMKEGAALILVLEILIDPELR